MPGASGFHHLDILLYAVFPYVALILFLAITIQRYRSQAFSYTSLSSQFLENKQHFWGMVPFHYGILTVLAGHVVAFCFPRSVLWWNAQPARLWILEITALVAGLLTLVGLGAVILRRTGNARLRAVTSPADWIVFAMLLFQVGTGVWVALAHRWGSSWFAASLTPYLRSLLFLNPDIAYVTAMPTMVKTHIVSAFALIAFFPFTRLVHILVIPNMYLWRKTQVVRWYAERRTLRRIERTGGDA
ncbi:MAG: respiratory nitrate reductase subunit gamma [Planctomycetes bacterium]|nr:respiratory nitrate reductase subunit gamma [Planctomycetota bacterium]